MNGTDECPPKPDVAEVAAGTPQAVTPHAGTGGAPAKLDTASLFAGRNEVRLIHRGQEYRLRVTRQGKLILTK